MDLWQHVESGRLGVVGLEGFGCTLWKEVFLLKSVYCVVDLVDVVRCEILVHFLVEFGVAELAFGLFYITVHILDNDSSPFVCFRYNDVVAIFQ